MKIVEKNRNDKKVKPKLGKESELWARLTPKFKIISKFSLQNFNITISVLHDSTDILTVKYNQNWQFKRKQNFLNSVCLKWIFLHPPPPPPLMWNFWICSCLFLFSLCLTHSAFFFFCSTYITHIISCIYFPAHMHTYFIVK